MAINSDQGTEFLKQTIHSNSKVTLEEAIFRSEEAFRPANLQEYKQFWENEILREHPQRTTLLNWIEGVKIEEFLNSFTDSNFKGLNYNHIIHMNNASQTMSHLNLRDLWTRQFSNG